MLLAILRQQGLRHPDLHLHYDCTQGKVNILYSIHSLIDSEFKTSKMTKRVTIDKI